MQPFGASITGLPGAATVPEDRAEMAMAKRALFRISMVNVVGWVYVAAEYGLKKLGLASRNSSDD